VSTVRKGVLVPTLATLAAFAVLVSLGQWQLSRKVWKETLIDAMTQRLAAAPQDLPPPEKWGELTPDNAEFRRVKLRGEFIPVRDTYAYVAGSALRNDIKEPGYFVFRPVRLANSKLVTVNRGYVPLEYTQQTPGGESEVTGYIRFPEPKSWFVTESSSGGDTWFIRNPQLMAKARGWGEVAPFYIDQELPVPASGLPKPSALSVTLRNDHLGYALTWFGLAATLVGVFLAWLIARRRNKDNSAAA
jgi:cytochrome oxidase assembly protein ShyY1